MANRLVQRPGEAERIRRAVDLGVSPKRLHGWEPRSVQRGYDRDGQRVALADAWEIVTEREVEWDDRQRALIEGLAEYDAGICECGLHVSLTDTDEHDSKITLPVCKSCAAVQRYERMLIKVDNDLRGDDPPAERYDRADGRRIRLTYKGKAVKSTTTPEA